MISVIQNLLFSKFCDIECLVAKKYCKDYLINKKQFSIAKSQEDECVLSISKKHIQGFQNS